jgi:hypothetical protein
MEDHLQAALAFYAWLFERPFSPDEVARAQVIASEAASRDDNIAMNVVRHAAERWDAVQASGGAIDRSAYMPEAVTLLRELDSPLCQWLVARYDEANPPLVEGEIALTSEIIDGLFELRQLMFGETESEPELRELFVEDTLQKWAVLNPEEQERAARAPTIWMTYRVTRPRLLQDGITIDFNRLLRSFDDRGLISTPFDWSFDHYLSERIGERYEPVIGSLAGDADAADPLFVLPRSPPRRRLLGGVYDKSPASLIERLFGRLMRRADRGPGHDDDPQRPDVDIRTTGGEDPRTSHAEPPEYGPQVATNGNGEPKPATANGGGPEQVAANGGDGSPDADEVPQKAYPLIQCEDIVVAGQEFTLEVGLSKKAVLGVTGGEMIRPDRGRDPYQLTIRVLTPGMAIRHGEHWKETREVTADNPYPTVELHVTPEPQAEGTRPGKITVDYSIGSQPMGMAERNLVVIRDESFRARARVGPQEEAEFPMPPLKGAPHITVKIWDWDNGKLRWTIDLDPDLSGIEINDDAWFSDIGASPETFTSRLVSDLDNYDEDKGIEKTVRSYSRQLSEKVPEGVWPVVAEVRRMVKAPPSVLIMTQEPYLPWELAQVPEEYRDKKLGEVLGTHAAVARWVLAKRPPPPDATAVEVKGIGVIAGLYQGNSALKHAIAERKEMMLSYKASEIPAQRSPFIKYLDKSKDQVIHFAVHGEYAASPSEDGIILEDGIVPQSTIDGSTLAAKPLVFINACKLGGAGKLLDEYSGMASAFLVAGGCGVIAPLWSIRDDISARVASEFYKAVFTKNIPVAEALRRLRTKFMRRGYKSATCLAYLYYGHPALKLSR